MVATATRSSVFSACANSSRSRAISASIYSRPLAVTRLRAWLTGRSPTMAMASVSSSSLVKALLIGET